MNPDIFTIHFLIELGWNPTDDLFDFLSSQFGVTYHEGKEDSRFFSRRVKTLHKFTYHETASKSHSYTSPDFNKALRSILRLIRETKNQKQS